MDSVLSKTVVGPMKFQSHRICCLYRAYAKRVSDKEEAERVQKLKANQEAERRKEEEIVKQKEAEKLESRKKLAEKEEQFKKSEESELQAAKSPL